MFTFTFHNTIIIVNRVRLYFCGMSENNFKYTFDINDNKDNIDNIRDYHYIENHSNIIGHIYSKIKQKVMI